MRSESLRSRKDCARSVVDTTGRVWVVGSIGWDRVYAVDAVPARGGFAEARSFEVRPGGTGLNTAVGLASADVDTLLVGYVGRDGTGDSLLQWLETLGLETSYIQRWQVPTAEVAILVDSEGERTMVGAHEDALGSLNFPCARVSRGDIVFFSAAAPAKPSVLEELRNSGAVVVSVPSGVEALEAADYLLGSEEQFEENGGISSYAAAMRNAVACKEVIVTHGEEGVRMLSRKGEVHIPAESVSVKDATGAGDAFAAGMLAGLVRGESIEQSVRLGNRWGASAVAREGSTPPEWADVFGEEIR
ncbi:carbohydrate kinase family protein [Thiohalocapsa halophila]|nr:PfkB family carbohydrate kinase [Thiohalocapsa halophila]